MKVIVSPWLPQSLHRESWHHSQFSSTERLHQGYCSSVYLVKDKQTGQDLVLKVYNTEELSPLLLHQLQQEVEIHSTIHHFSIVQFYAAWEEGPRCFILLEFAPEGDLSTKLMSEGRLSEQTVVSWMLQPCLSALGFLHGRGILHRDLKPENFVISKTATGHVLKLTDFGLAIDETRFLAMARTGTLDYMAPEVLSCSTMDGPESTPANRFKSIPAYGNQVDVWSLGAVLYELLVGAPPFEGEDAESTVHEILYVHPDTSSLSEDACDFLSRCLTKDPKRRPTIGQLMGHRWVQVHGVSSTRYDSGQMERLRQAGRYEAYGGNCGSVSMRGLPAHVMSSMQRGLHERSSMPRISSLSNVTSAGSNASSSSTSVSVNSLYNISADDIMGMTHDGGYMEQQVAPRISDMHPSLEAHFAQRMNIGENAQAAGTWHHHGNPAEMYYPMGTVPPQHHSVPTRSRAAQHDHMQGQPLAGRPDMQAYPSAQHNSGSHPSMEALIPQHGHMQGQPFAGSPDMQAYPSMQHNSGSHPSMEALIRAKSGNQLKLYQQQ